MKYRFSIGIVLFLFLMVSSSALFLKAGSKQVYEDEVRDLPLFLWHIPWNPIKALYLYDFSYSDRTTAPAVSVLFGIVFKIFYALTENKFFALRSFSIISGVLTVIFTFLLAKKLFGMRVALISSNMLFSSGLFIFLSRFALYYIPKLPLVIGAYYFALGKNKKPIIAGLFLAFAFLVRYDSILSFIPIIIYYSFKDRRALAKFLIVPTVIVVPYIFAQWGNVSYILFSEANGSNQKIPLLEFIFDFVVANIFLLLPLMLFAGRFVKSAELKIILLNFLFYFSYYIVFLRWAEHYIFNSFVFMAWSLSILAGISLSRLKNKVVVPYIVIAVIITFLNVQGLTDFPLSNAKFFGSYPDWSRAISFVEGLENSSIALQQPAVFWFVLAEDFSRGVKHYFLYEENNSRFFGYYHNNITLYHSAFLADSTKINDIDYIISAKPVENISFWPWTLSEGDGISSADKRVVQAYRDSVFGVEIFEVIRDKGG